jgi:maltose O-acetyltransferase
MTKLAAMVRSFILNELLASVLIPARLRVVCCRLFGMRIGAGASIYPMCFFAGTNIAIGHGTFINSKCFFDNLAAITIGERCQLAQDVMVCTSSHKIGESNQRAGVHAGAPIVIADGCWLGTRVTVLPGVTVGEGCVIAAGAVVTSDCEPNGLYAGIPARRVRDLT